MTPVGSILLYSILLRICMERASSSRREHNQNFSSSGRAMSEAASPADLARAKVLAGQGTDVCWVADRPARSTYDTIVRVEKAEDARHTIASYIQPLTNICRLHRHAFRLQRGSKNQEFRVISHQHCVPTKQHVSAARRSIPEFHSAYFAFLYRGYDESGSFTVFSQFRVSGRAAHFIHVVDFRLQTSDSSGSSFTRRRGPLRYDHEHVRDTQ